MDVAIVGSGIAGLSAAVALRRVGIQASVYERAPELREVGAGISLWANALRALDYIGAGEAVRRASLHISQFELRTNEGRRIRMGLDAKMVEQQFGIPEYARMIHRADLVAAIASHLPTDSMHFGYECTAIDNLDSHVRLHFDNRQTRDVDLVIGADGIRSVVRDAVQGKQEPRYSGYTCWRGICPRPASIEVGYVGEWWGRGKRFGITTIPDDRIYWFAVENAQEGMQWPDERERLLATFAGWADPCPDLIDSTPTDRILRNDIHDRKPNPTWSKGRVGIIGDAAHSTTPNLGQGGCMAIEDAAVLARQVKAHSDPAEAWVAFTNERYRHTSAIVRDSWTFGRIAQKEGRVTCWLRDVAIGLSARLLSPTSLLKYVMHDVGPLTTSAE